jgi:MFS family permease
MLAALNFGYNVGFGTPAAHAMKIDQVSVENHTFQWFRTVYYLSAIPGAFSAPGVLYFCGRRTATSIYTGAGAVMWLLFYGFQGCPYGDCPSSYAYAVAIRALCGFIVGGTSVIIPMYLVEIGPPESTGFFGTLNQIAISFGIVFCSLVALKESWELMVGIGAGICVFCAGLIWLIPESPAVAEVNPTMIVGADNETILAKKWLWPLVVILLMSFFQQSTGINPLLSVIDKLVGSDDRQSKVAQIGATVAQVVGNFIGAFLTEYLGRRAVWVISLAGITVAVLVYAALVGSGYLKDDNTSNVAGLVVIFVYLLAFGLGAGPIPWFLAPEVFPVRIRALAQAFMAVSNWIFAWLSMLLAYIMRQNVVAGEYVKQAAPYIVFAVLSAGGTLFGLFYIKNPEIQAREELHKNVFDDLVSQ